MDGRWLLEVGPFLEGGRRKMESTDTHASDNTRRTENHKSIRGASTEFRTAALFS